MGYKKGKKIGEVYEAKKTSSPIGWIVFIGILVLIGKCNDTTGKDIDPLPQYKIEVQDTGLLRP